MKKTGISIENAKVKVICADYQSESPKNYLKKIIDVENYFFEFKK